MGCALNILDYSYFPESERDGFTALSTLHQPGLIRILDGPSTHPEPPPTPPSAKVYPEEPTPESVRIQFELVGPQVTHPGAADVPFDLHLTSSHELSGFMTGVRFPAEHLELLRVDEHTRPGVLAIDNQAGGMGLLLSTGRRRVGSEGERVRIATLHFRVKEEAREAGALEVRFGRFGNFYNWLGIQHRGGLTDEDLPITAEVSPTVLTHALLRVQSKPTQPGDVNLDYSVDITDPISLLGQLFLGVDATCPAAGDYNQDGQLNLADPVAILQYLFHGRAPGEGEIECAGGPASRRPYRA
jgi:hypothetical protein